MELKIDETISISERDIWGDYSPTEDEKALAFSIIEGGFGALKEDGIAINSSAFIETAKTMILLLKEANDFIKEHFPMYGKTEIDIVAKFVVGQYQAFDKTESISFREYLEHISLAIESTLSEVNRRLHIDDIKSVTTNDVVKLIYPIDRVNRKIWDLQEIISNEELKIGMESDEDEKKGKQINLYFTFDFDQIEKEIEAVNRLIPYDKRVYIAVSGEFEAGNHTTSLTNIYRSMGYTGRPGATDLERISDSLTKMSLIQITVDNKEEARVYNYPRFRYKGQMLPIERIEAIVDGNILDASVHLFREPPLYTFAKERNHISTIEIDVLQSPISKTKSNLMLEDYILDRFLKARHGNANPRVLYTTLHKHLSIDKTTSAGKKAIARLPDKVTKLLDHYVNTGFISGYSTDTRGIKASFRQEVQEKKEKKKTKKTVKQ